jgi:Spy/CpxP family protein refolding chaperone
MKNIAFLFLLFIASNLVAQQESKHEKLEAMKIAFITEKLSLTTKEAQNFWPVYNEYSQKIEKLRKTKRSDLGELKINIENSSDKEIEALLSDVFDAKTKEIELQKEYYSKYTKVLPIKKVALLYQSEHQFKKELLKRIKDKR